MQPFFVERVFQIFDKDDSGSISFQEFIDAIHQFAGQTPEDKIKFLFKVYDIDGKRKQIIDFQCLNYTVHYTPLPCLNLKDVARFKTWSIPALFSAILNIKSGLGLLHIR